VFQVVRTVNAAQRIHPSTQAQVNHLHDLRQRPEGGGLLDPGTAP